MAAAPWPACRGRMPTPLPCSSAATAPRSARRGGCARRPTACWNGARSNQPRRRTRMSQKLAGKVALVTGSGRGIGRQIALKLASEGARLVVNDLDAGPADETMAEIRAAGGEAVACNGDVTADGFAERFVQTGIDTFGGLDIIVNNAGYTWDNVIQKMTD